MEDVRANQKEQIRMEIALSKWKERIKLRIALLVLVLVIVALILGALGLASAHPVSIFVGNKAVGLSAGDIVLTRACREPKIGQAVFVRMEGNVCPVRLVATAGDWVCATNNSLRVNGNDVAGEVEDLVLQQIPEGSVLALFEGESGAQIRVIGAEEAFSEIWLRVYPLNRIGNIDAD